MREEGEGMWLSGRGDVDEGGGGGYVALRKRACE